MKVQVKRAQNGAGNTIYIAQQKDHKGRYRTYSEKEYKANPDQFEIVGGLAESHRVAIHEVTPLRDKPLPKPLGELNELIAALTPFRRKRTRDEIVAEAQRMLDEKQEFLRKLDLKESWQRRGLSPEAAEVAARVETEKRPADLPPVTEWASVMFKAYGGR